MPTLRSSRCQDRNAYCEGGNVNEWVAGKYVRIIYGKTNLNEDDLRTWHEWYNATHLPALVAAPGVIAGRRFRQVGSESDYLTILEFDTVSANETDEYFQATGGNPFPDGVQNPGVATTFEEIFRHGR
jgi:hypothetical protein